MPSAAGMGTEARWWLPRCCVSASSLPFGTVPHFTLIAISIADLTGLCWSERAGRDSSVRPAVKASLAAKQVVVVERVERLRGEHGGGHGEAGGPGAVAIDEAWAVAWEELAASAPWQASVR